MLTWPEFYFVLFNVIAYTWALKKILRLDEDRNSEQQSS